MPDKTEAEIEIGTIAIDMDRAMEALPALRDASDRSKTILALRSVGLSYRAIGTQLGITRQTVLRTCQKHDPEGRLKMPLDMRTALLKEQLASLIFEALSNIKPEELAKARPTDLMRIAKDAASAMKSLNPKERERRHDNLEEILKRARPIEVSAEGEEDGEAQELRSV